MRTLILLLLVCVSVAGAQVPVPKSTYRWVVNTPTRELPDTNIWYGDTASFNPRGMKNLLNDILMCFDVLWDQYSAECWADSEEVENVLWVPVETRARITGGDYFLGSAWRHAEPTFPGFMEFLRRRRGR